MNTISRKTSNRVKGLLGSIGVGEKIDLGKPHAKGYRITCGRTSTGTQARFWLGHDHTAAQQRANLIVSVWAAMASAGTTAWTPELIARTKAMGDKTVEATKPFIAAVRETAVTLQQEANLYAARNADLLGTAATHAPVAPTLAERSQAGPSLYDAIKAYLEALEGKRVSEGHRWRAEQVLERTLKGVRADVPLSKIDYLWLDTLADHFKSRPLSKKSVEEAKRISPQTVKTTLSYIRQFFVWVDDVSYGNWEGPRKLTKPFRVRLDDLRTRAGTTSPSTSGSTS